MCSILGSIGLEADRLVVLVVAVLEGPVFEVAQESTTSVAKRRTSTVRGACVVRAAAARAASAEVGVACDVGAARATAGSTVAVKVL
jgi:hypothetical protein